MKPRSPASFYVATGGVVLAALVVCALLLWNLQVRRDWAFICRNTGSQKGHTEWIFGIKAGSWYKQSELERFMAANHPGELEHDWVSYAGTGRNIFGAAVLHGHGRPGPIILIRPEELDRHVRRLNTDGRKALYDLLASGDRERIEQELDRIAVSAAEDP